MAGKDRIVAEPEDGFFELKPRRDAPTESKIDAAEPHKLPKPNVKKKIRKTKKERENCFIGVMTTSILLDTF